MDVDPDFFTSPPSAEKRPKLDLPPAQQMELNQSMIEVSSDHFWGKRVEMARDDELAWRKLLSDVLLLMSTLAITDLEGGYALTKLTKKQANDTTMDLGGSQLMKLKDGMLKGIKKSDWADLIADRTYCQKWPHVSHSKTAQC